MAQLSYFSSFQGSSWSLYNCSVKMASFEGELSFSVISFSSVCGVEQEIKPVDR